MRVSSEIKPLKDWEVRSTPYCMVYLCEKKYHARSLCRAHYSELHRNGMIIPKLPNLEPTRPVIQKPIRVVESTVTREEVGSLAKSIGIDVRSLKIKPKAEVPWARFQDALEFDTERNCKGRESEFIDYEEIPSPQKALDMCADCPLLLHCRAFSTAEKPGWGVWGGKVYGEAES